MIDPHSDDGEEVDTWMTAPTEIAIELQLLLPDNTLRIVARGQKQDGKPPR